MTDEREGLPSASGAPRYALCGGSFLLEQQAHEEDPSPDAERGTRIHDYVAGLRDTLDCPEELETAHRIIDIRDQILGSMDIPEDARRVEEVRLWAIDDQGRKRWSGKPDLVVTWGNRAVVMDWKSGWGQVPGADVNLQGRALAVLAMEEYLVTEVIVIFVHPNLSPACTSCLYTFDDLLTAAAEIHPMMERVKSPGLPRTPSHAACRWCKAKPICREALATLAVVSTPRPKRSIDMTPAQVAEFLDKAQVAEQVIDSIRSKARRILEAGIEIPGWKLEARSGREKIVNTWTVAERFMAMGGTPEDFIRAVGISKTALKDALRVATGTKGKDLDRQLKSILEGCIDVTPTAKSLVRA